MEFVTLKYSSTSNNPPPLPPIPFIQLSALSKPVSCTVQVHIYIYPNTIYPNPLVNILGIVSHLVGRYWAVGNR